MKLRTIIFFFTYDFYSYLILFKVGLCIVDFDSLGF